MNPEDTVAAQWYAENVQVHETALRDWLRVKFPFLTDRDNLVQESLTRVWRIQQRDAVKSPKALLFTTARNLAPFESFEEIDGLSVLDEGASAAEAAAHQQELELLLQAVQALPPRCREVLTLRRIYGLSQKEIAAQLHLSEATVETHVGNGLRACTKFLARFGLP